MVLVVIVEMFVFLRFMNMLVFVSLADVQPNAREHEGARNAKDPIETTFSEGKGERSARERCGGEIGPGSRCTEMAERLNEKDEADAISEETDRQDA
jgi:hypothetical protein